MSQPRVNTRDGGDFNHQNEVYNDGTCDTADGTAPVYLSRTAEDMRSGVRSCTMAKYSHPNEVKRRNDDKIYSDEAQSYWKPMQRNAELLNHTTSSTHSLRLLGQLDLTSPEDDGFAVHHELLDTAELSSICFVLKRECLTRIDGMG